MNEKLEKLNQQIAQGEAKLRRAARRKDTGTSDKTAYPEGTDAPALHQRGYAGKFPDKAGSADGR